MDLRDDGCVMIGPCVQQLGVIILDEPVPHPAQTDGGLQHQTQTRPPPPHQNPLALKQALPLALAQKDR